MMLSRRLQGAAGAAIVPTAFATLSVLAALPPTPAQAQAPGADLRVLTPRQGEALGALVFNLDVSFKSLTSSPVTTAELWVDGVRWVRRDLEKPLQASTLSFEVDGTSLSAGPHTIVVKVFTANGGVSSTRVQVVAGTNQGVVAGDLGGPEMSFLTPLNGKRVSGTVELLLDAKSRTGQSPYVTIYIDKQFKTLKNYPPYSYTWDTTQVPNGYHTIEAMGYLDSANATTTRTMRVYVDNPGGNTVRKGDIEDLTAARNQTEANPTTAANMAVRPLVIPQPKRGAIAPAVIAAPTGEAKLAGAPATIAGDTTPAGLGLAAAPAVSAARAAADVRLATPGIPASVKKVEEASAAPAPAAPLAVASAETRTATPSLAAAPRPVAPKTAPAIARPVTLKPTAVAAAPTMAAPRASAVATPAPKVAKKVASAPSAARPTGLRPLPDAAMRGSLQVAFDGQKIAFDVQPRVEAGLPLAPFRQIFEHTGGKVTWSPQTKVVHAVNAEREIVIGVGNGTAKVNGTSVLMERAAFLESGRTIVPLSFVGQALDVDVQYDPATGRLQITSKK